MALLWLDSVDYYNTSTVFDRYPTTAVGNFGTINVVPSPRGGSPLNGALTGIGPWQIVIPLTGAAGGFTTGTTAFTWGSAIYCSAPTFISQLSAITINNNPSIPGVNVYESISVGPDGTIYIIDYSTGSAKILAQSQSGAFAFNSIDMYMEVNATYNVSTKLLTAVAVYINQNLVCQATGLNITTTEIPVINFGDSTGRFNNTLTFDDIYVADNTGLFWNQVATVEFNCRSICVRVAPVSSNGLTQSWTVTPGGLSPYLAVNAIPLQQNTLIISSGANSTEMFNTTPQVASAVLAVQTTVFAGGTVAHPNTEFNLGIALAFGTSVIGSPFTFSTGPAVYCATPFGYNSDTNQPWGLDDLNGMQILIQENASSSFPTNCFMMLMEVAQPFPVPAVTLPSVNGMLLNDIVSLFRVEMEEPDPSGRWSSTDVATLANAACREVGLRLLYPQGTITLSGGTITGQQEYPGFPLVNKVLRVYLGGQRLVETDISTMEGDQIQLWDQTAQGNIPQWKFQQSETYPVSSPTGYPYPAGLPYWPGQRPVYYFRGGNLGIVPAPAGNYSLTIDVVPVPVNLVNLTDESDLPINFCEAIVWKMCWLAHKADGDDEQANAAAATYREVMGLCRTWIRQKSNKVPQWFVYPERAKWYNRRSGQRNY